MKVSELSDGLLTYWVERADGVPEDDLSLKSRGDKVDCYRAYRIDDMDNWSNKESHQYINAQIRKRLPGALSEHDALVGAMRAYVESKFGDEVPDVVT
jgi:hypothetical protein